MGGKKRSKKKKKVNTTTKDIKVKNNKSEEQIPKKEIEKVISTEPSAVSIETEKLFFSAMTSGGRENASTEVQKVLNEIIKESKLKLDEKGHYIPPD